MKYKFYLIVFILLTISGIGNILIEENDLPRQNSGQINLTHETDGISGGAEISTFLNMVEKTRNAEKFRFHGNLEKTAGAGTPVINAVSPIAWNDFDTDASYAGYYNIPPDPIGERLAPCPPRRD